MPAALMPKPVSLFPPTPYHSQNTDTLATPQWLTWAVARARHWDEHVGTIVHRLAALAHLQSRGQEAKARGAG